MDPRNGNPDLSYAIEKLGRDIESLKRQIRGVPEERRPGMQDTLAEMEREHARLERELEKEREVRRADLQTLREIVKEVQINLMMAEVKVRWAMWGLSGFGLLSIVASTLAYIFFNRLAGGAP